MSRLFFLILETSLYASVVGISILLIKLLFSRRLDAQWHYILWVVLLVKLLIPYSPQSAWSLFNVVPEFSVERQFISSVPVNLPEPRIVQTGPSMPQVGAIPVQPGVDYPGMQNEKVISFKSILPYMWLAGLGFAALWLMSVHTFLSVGLYKLPAVSDPRLLALLKSAKAKMHVKGEVALIVQDIVAAPSLFGLYSPRILITQQTAALPDDELEYILLHELAHYKRKDLLINYLLIGLHIVHWFNPVIWYCFKQLRTDMEVATDAHVLNSLAQAQHKAYGLTLLRVLEGVVTPKLAPKLLGMVDDKKTIRHRLSMVKLAGYYQQNRYRFALVGVFCLALLGSVLLTRGLTNPFESTGGAPPWDAEKLLSYRTPYVGDNSKVVNIVNTLPLAQYRGKVSLQTNSRPYMITVEYSDTHQDPKILENTLRKNAVVMFSLIENVDAVTFMVGAGVPVFNFQRTSMENEMATELYEHSRNKKVFEALLMQVSCTLYSTFPGYLDEMSSLPGIVITPHADYPVKTVRYEVDSGTFLTWVSSKVTEYGPLLELPYPMPVVWRAGDGSESESKSNKITLTATFLDAEDREVAKQQLIILRQESGYFVAPTPGVVTGNQPLLSLDGAVSQAIKSRETWYGKGEVFTEGHIILETAEQDGTVIVYTIASSGWFGFENNIFTKISGSGAIPTVITFQKNANGQLTLLDYREPLDGGDHLKSLQAMFPRKLWDRVIHANEDYSTLAHQEEEQAKTYLLQIGREAKVQTAHVEKQLPNINVEASNKLFGEMTKFDVEFNRFPYWIGTREIVLDGSRYVYETLQSKNTNGNDLMIFRKYHNGRIVLERRYEIIGSNPRLISE